MTLTARQYELIEVALESAISACNGFPPSAGDDPLVTEYRDALAVVREMQKEPEAPLEIVVDTDEETIACPYCQGGDIREVDKDERWNECTGHFDGGKLVQLDISQQDSEYQTDRYICASCQQTVAIPAGVESYWG